MKILPVAILLLSTCLTHYGQYIGFITRSGTVDAAVTLPGGSPVGPDFQAQLFRVFEDGSLLPLLPTTTFQTGDQEPRLRYYVNSTNVLVPDISFPDPVNDEVEVTLRMRAWEGPTWDSAPLRGEAQDINLLLRSLLYPPTSLTGLRPFVVQVRQGITASSFEKDGLVHFDIKSPEDATTLVVERSIDLVTWQVFGEFPVSDAIDFTDPDIAKPGMAFFRIRFQ